MKKKAKTAAAPVPMVYCGPKITNVVSQYQVFTNGITDILARELETKPLLKAFLVPLEKMSEVRLGLKSNTGKWAALFKKCKEEY